MNRNLFSGVAGEVSGKFQNIGDWFKWFEKNIVFLKMLTLPIVLFKNEWSWTYIVVGWPLGRWDFWKKSKKIELSTHIKVIFNNLWYQIFDRVFLKKKRKNVRYIEKNPLWRRINWKKQTKVFEKFFTAQIYRE